MEQLGTEWPPSSEISYTSNIELNKTLKALQRENFGFPDVSPTHNFQLCFALLTLAWKSKVFVWFWFFPVQRNLSGGVNLFRKARVIIFLPFIPRRKVNLKAIENTYYIYRYIWLWIINVRRKKNKADEHKKLLYKSTILELFSLVYIH